MGGEERVGGVGCGLNGVEDALACGGGLQDVLVSTHVLTQDVPGDAEVDAVAELSQ